MTYLWRYSISIGKTKKKEKHKTNIMKKVWKKEKKKTKIKFKRCKFEKQKIVFYSKQIENFSWIGALGLNLDRVTLLQIVFETCDLLFNSHLKRDFTIVPVMILINAIRNNNNVIMTIEHTCYEFDYENQSQYCPV